MPTLSRGEVELLRGTGPETLLAMRCTIERFSESGTDAYGHPVRVWSTLHDSIPCWWGASDGRGRGQSIEGPDVNALVSRERIVLAAGVDVTTQDRVARVYGVDGEQVAGALRIQEVLERAAETVLLVEAVGAP